MLQFYVIWSSVTAALLFSPKCRRNAVFFCVLKIVLKTYSFHYMLASHTSIQLECMLYGVYLLMILNCLHLVLIFHFNLPTNMYKGKNQIKRPTKSKTKARTHTHTPKRDKKQSKLILRNKKKNKGITSVYFFF